jgi:polar amino acid transport system substrate-binding protein
MNLFHVNLPCKWLNILVFWLFVVVTPLLANESAQSAKALRLAVIYIEEPPFVYTTTSSEYRGIVPSLAKALSRELGLTLEYLPTPRRGLEQSLIDGKADITWLSADWVTHKEQLIFSDPVFLHREFLYSLEPFSESGAPVELLKDKTICIRQDYQYPTLNRFFAGNIAKSVQVSSQVPLFNLLLKKRCDVLYLNEYRANWMASSLGVSGNIWRSPKPLAETKLAFMFHTKWQTKMAKVNQALGNIKRSGEFETIIQSNIHPTIVSKVTTD